MWKSRILTSWPGNKTVTSFLGSHNPLKGHSSVLETSKQTTPLKICTIPQQCLIWLLPPALQLGQQNKQKSMASRCLVWSPSECHMLFPSAVRCAWIYWSDLESQICELKKPGDHCTQTAFLLLNPVAITFVLFRLDKSQPSSIRARFNTNNKTSYDVMLCTRQKNKASKVHPNATLPGCFLGSCVRLVECAEAPKKMEKCKLQRANLSQYSYHRIICLKVHSISSSQKCYKTRSCLFLNIREKSS